MTALAKIHPHSDAAPAIVAPALVPTSMREAIELAQFMSRAKLVPKALQDAPGDCLLVIEQAMRWEMSPFAVAQEVSSIQGKLMYSGKLVAAVVNARGPKYGLTGRLLYDYSLTGDDRTVTVSGEINGRREEVSVRLGDVKTQNEQWKKQPDQQLAYHGARVWARRHMPELMLGIWSPEEFEAPTTPPGDTPPPAAAKPETRPPAEPAREIVDPETGEVSEPRMSREIKPPETNDLRKRWQTWGQLMTAAANSARTEREWQEVKDDNAQHWNDLHDYNETWWNRLAETFEKNLARLRGTDGDDGGPSRFT